MTTRVLIVDDHPVFRSGLRGAVATAADTAVVGEAANGADAVRLVRELAPDVVLMDLQMDGMSGVEATRAILAFAPATAVLVLTMSQDDASMFAALRAGARGYLLKGVGEEEIVAAIAAVHRGEAVFGAGVAQRVLDSVTGREQPPPAPFPELTPREREILNLVAAGYGNAGIAARLSVAPKTVRNAVSILLAKISADDRAHAVRLGRAAGLGSPERR